MLIFPISVIRLAIADRNFSWSMRSSDPSKVINFQGSCQSGDWGSFSLMILRVNSILGASVEVPLNSTLSACEKSTVINGSWEEKVWMIACSFSKVISSV